MTNKKILWVFYFFIFIDQFTKFLAMNLITYDQEYKVNNFFSLHTLLNENIILGNVEFNVPTFIFASFSILTTIIILFFIYKVLNSKELQKTTIIHTKIKLGLIAFAASGIGNGIDRIFYGGVVDFLRLNDVFAESHSLILNVADIVLYIGEFFIFSAMISYLFIYLFNKKYFSVINK